MKTLSFRPILIESILNGTKTVTWRLFDDKNLTVGDRLQFLNWETKAPFAEAVIAAIREKPLGEITKEDYTGHDPYVSQADMLERYRKLYGPTVNLETLVKMITFRLG